jgi:hypothetical protein
LYSAFRIQPALPPLFALRANSHREGQTQFSITIRVGDAIGALIQELYLDSKKHAAKLARNMNDFDIEDQPPPSYNEQNQPGAAKNANRPRAKKFIVNATGHIGMPAKKKSRKGTPSFVQPPVKIAPELVESFAKSVRYMPKKVNNYVRFAVANVILKSPGAFDYPEEDLWDAIGRWNSLLRGVTAIEGVTQRHHGWEHVQRLRAALARAANDPALQAKTRWRHNQFIAAALLALDKALEAYFRDHEHELMSPEEFAGMAPMPIVNELRTQPLFRKPKSKALDDVEREPDPEFLPPPEEIAARRERGPQKPALFGGTKPGTD